MIFQTQYEIPSTRLHGMSLSDLIAAMRLRERHSLIYGFSGLLALIVTLIIFAFTYDKGVSNAVLIPTWLIAIVLGIYTIRVRVSLRAVYDEASTR